MRSGSPLERFERKDEKKLGGKELGISKQIRIE